MSEHKINFKQPSPYMCLKKQINKNNNNTINNNKKLDNTINLTEKFVLYNVKGW